MDRGEQLILLDGIENDAKKPGIIDAKEMRKIRRCFIALGLLTLAVIIAAIIFL